MPRRFPVSRRKTLLLLLVTTLFTALALLAPARPAHALRCPEGYTQGRCIFYYSDADRTQLVCSECCTENCEPTPYTRVLTACCLLD